MNDSPGENSSHILISFSREFFSIKGGVLISNARDAGSIPTDGGIFLHPLLRGLKAVVSKL